MLVICRKIPEQIAAAIPKHIKVQFGTKKMQLGAEMPSFFALCGTKIAATQTGKQVKSNERDPE